MLSFIMYKNNWKTKYRQALYRYKKNHHCNVIVLLLTQANMRNYHKPNLIGHSESRNASLPDPALDEQCNIMAL